MWPCTIFPVLQERIHSFQIVNSRLNPFMLLVVHRVTKSPPKIDLQNKAKPYDVLFGNLGLVPWQESVITSLVPQSRFFKLRSLVPT